MNSVLYHIMNRKIATLAFSLVALSLIISGQHVFAESELKFYGKGTIDETSISPQVMIRTLIDHDRATFIRTGAGGIDVVRLDITESCEQTQSTACFEGTVTKSNNEMHAVGDKVTILLDLANKREVVSFDSGQLQGTTFHITLSKSQIILDGPYQINLSQSGGFAGISKEFTINYGELTQGDAMITLDSDTISTLTKDIKKARLFDMTATDYPPVAGSAGYFSYSLEVSQGVYSKTITWTDTSENVPEPLNDIKGMIQGLVNVPRPGAGMDTIQVAMAKEFVKTSPTFAFDGMIETLKLVDAKVLESFPEQYLITLNFTSTHGGYGDRTNQIVTEALTPHTMLVTIIDGNVTSAVTDDTWDELNHQYVLKAP